MYTKINAENSKIIEEMYCTKMYSAKRIGFELNLNEKTVFRYLKNKGLTRPVGKNYKYMCNEHFFSNIDSEEKAYWLGVIFADGNVSLNTSKTGQLFISSKDKEWLNLFLQSIQSTSPLYREFHKKYQKEIWKVHITSNQLFNDLNLLGVIPNKSLVIKFPNISENLIPHFIRGYFDGDGFVSVTKYLKDKDDLTLRSGICSGSREFLETLITYLPIKHKYISSRKNLFEFKLSVNDSIKFAQYMYKDATIYLQRKFDKFNNFVKQRRSTTIIDNPKKD